MGDASPRNVMSQVKGVKTPPPRFLERPALPDGIARIDAELSPGDRLGDVVRDEHHLERTMDAKFFQKRLNALSGLGACQEHDVMPQLSDALGSAPAIQGFAPPLRIARVGRHHDSHWRQTAFVVRARPVFTRQH